MSYAQQQYGGGGGYQQPQQMYGQPPQQQYGQQYAQQQQYHDQQQQYGQPQTNGGAAQYQQQPPQYQQQPPQYQQQPPQYQQQPPQYQNEQQYVAPVAGVPVVKFPQFLTQIPPGWTNPYLPPDLIEKAARELKETDQSRQEGLAGMRALIAKEKKMTFHRTDDLYLLSFLRCRKFNVAKAYKNMKAYTEFYEENKHLVASTDMNRLRKVYESGFSRVLPGTDKHGRRVSVIIARNLTVDPTTKPTDIGEDMLRFNLLLLDYVLQDVYVQVNGLVVVETFQGFTMSQAMQMRKSQDPKMMKKSMALMQGIMPIRLQGCYLLHVPSYVSILMKFAKLFMSSKMRSRFHVWGDDFRPLHEQIDPRELPPELGGTLYEDPMLFWSTYERGLPISAFYRQGITDPTAPAPQRSWKDIDAKLTREEEQMAKQLGVDLANPPQEVLQQQQEAPEWTAIDD